MRGADLQERVHLSSREGLLACLRREMPRHTSWTAQLNVMHHAKRAASQQTTNNVVIPDLIQGYRVI